MGKGRIVAVSVSPVGRGTAGLLLMNGIPVPESPGAGEGPSSGCKEEAGELETQPLDGKEGNSPPEVGGGAVTGGKAMEE